MSLHTQDLTARMTRYLDRKAMPKRLDGKPMAQSDEIAALTALAAKHAPRDAEKLAEWWGLFSEKMGEIAGSMWPSEKELAEAARSIRGPAMVDLSGSASLDPAEIQAKRMKTGAGYAESSLWGIVACEIAARKLVDLETMTRCRSAAFHRRKAVYGEESALAWEADRKAEHEAAKIVWRDKSEPQPSRMPIPDMTSKPQGAAA